MRDPIREIPADQLVDLVRYGNLLVLFLIKALQKALQSYQYMNDATDSKTIYGLNNT
jgi:hypothetical protein